MHHPVRPHQLRHAYASNIADAGSGIDVAAITDPARLRAAVDLVPSPREQAGPTR